MKTPFVIYDTDDDGRAQGEPVDIVWLGETDDWQADKRTAVELYLDRHPEEHGNRGWKTAWSITREEIDKKVEKAQARLDLWKGFQEQY